MDITKIHNEFIKTYGTYENIATKIDSWLESVSIPENGKINIISIQYAVVNNFGIEHNYSSLNIQDNYVSNIEYSALITYTLE